MSENSTEEKLYCVYHPGRETLLRCNRCDQPICISCARLTPTGYRCKECLRTQQKVFDTATWVDYPVALVIAGTLGLLGSLVVSFIGFFTLLLAPAAGFIIAEAVRWAVRKRRSKRLFQLAAAAAALGSLPPALLPLIYAISTLVNGAPLGALSSLLPLVWHGLFTFLVTSTVFYRLSGIQMHR